MHPFVFSKYGTASLVRRIGLNLLYKYPLASNKPSQIDGHHVVIGSQTLGVHLSRFFVTACVVHDNIDLAELVDCFIDKCMNNFFVLNRTFKHVSDTLDAGWLLTLNRMNASVGNSFRLEQFDCFGNSTWILS